MYHFKCYNFFNTEKCSSAATYHCCDDYLIHMHLWKEQLECEDKQGNRCPHHCIHAEEEFYRLIDFFLQPNAAIQTLSTPDLCVFMTLAAKQSKNLHDIWVQPPFVSSI